MFLKAEKLKFKGRQHGSKDKTYIHILSCQPRVTVMSCFVYKVIRDLESIDHSCINPIHSIGLIHK